MSSRTLHLCVIVGKDSFNGKNLPSSSLISIPKACKGAIAMGSINPNFETTKSLVHSYCDVVVLRPPSPVKETMRCDTEGLDLVSASISLPVVQNDNNNTGSSSDSEEDNQSPWTLAQCRHTHSLDLANVPASNKFIRKKITLKGLSNKQKLAIKVAVATPTKEQ